jgi:hypothetical protein
MASGTAAARASSALTLGSAALVAVSPLLLVPPSDELPPQPVTTSVAVARVEARTTAGRGRERMGTWPLSFDRVRTRLIFLCRRRQGER